MGTKRVASNGRFDPQPSLQGLNLTRTYGQGDVRTIALRQVSLDLFRGRMALLMGPSGSGKSTLLAVLSGLLRPDSGRVLADGIDVWELSERQREQFRMRQCGFIFQGNNLFPALTTRQQLEIVLRWGQRMPVRASRRETDRMLGLLNLSKKAGLRPDQLSGGEKQRVAIGRALIKRPAYCFADEPTSALDWEHGEQVVELLRDAAHQQMSTILIVSHDSRILPLVDQVFQIEDGCLRERIIASDSVRMIR
jgi:putative ABC transport system ATP-binding protein